MLTVKIACERDDCLFMLVIAVVRHCAPAESAAKMSAGEATLRDETPIREMSRRTGSSWILMEEDESRSDDRRSMISSLYS